METYCTPDEDLPNWAKAKTKDDVKAEDAPDEVIISRLLHYMPCLEGRKVRVYKFSRQKFSRKLIFANFANLKKK